MTIPKARFVYSGNSLVRNNAQLVYSQYVDLIYGADYVDFRGTRQGMSLVSLSAALTDMQTAGSWAWFGGMAVAARSAYYGTGPEYGYSNAWWTRYGYVALCLSQRGIENETILGVNFPVKRYTVGAHGKNPTWRFGWYLSDDSYYENPTPTDWTWANTAPSISGSAEGTQYLPIGAAAKEFLYIVATQDPYEDISPLGQVADTYLDIGYLSGNAVKVLF